MPRDIIRLTQAQAQRIAIVAQGFADPRLAPGWGQVCDVQFESALEHNLPGTKPNGRLPVKSEASATLATWMLGARNGWLFASSTDNHLDACVTNSVIESAMKSSMGAVRLGKTPTQNVRFMTMSVLVRSPTTRNSTQNPPPTTLLHFAFLARDNLDALSVDEYASQNVAITTTVLGAIAKHKPRRVVVASSGAVYSSTGGFVCDLRADPYGTLKHLDELAFRAATRDVGGNCVIPRVFSVAGARMTKPRLYALGSMIGMAAMGPIEVSDRGPVFRSHCGVDEVVALALWAALAGRDAVFDTCGTVVEIADLARLVARVHGLDGGVVRRAWDPDVVPDRYVGDGRVMEELATEAGLSLRLLPGLVRETSAWLTDAWQDPSTPRREWG